jgi:threonine aldolase
MDGARVFNAAAGIGVDVRDIARNVDSIMVCLSKSLCAPVGSMVAGTRDFIKTARGRRKIMGGGMRQSGILAAAGLVALTRMTERVAEDRQKMQVLFDALSATGAFEMTPEKIQINMFFARFREPSLRGKEERLTAALRKRDIWVGVRHDGWIRFVAHNDISFEDIQKVCVALPQALEEARSSKAAAQA